MGPTTKPLPSSSSSTLWAQASKEWIIPARPKPGRKPKRESTSQLEEEPEDDGTANDRKVQNRAAQRAFRERKQSQIAEMQARLQHYEQGEIERNVHLQNTAKRLRDENDSLRAENTRLKEEIARLTTAAASETSERKRPLDSAAGPSPSTSLLQAMRKRQKANHDTSQNYDIFPSPPYLTPNYMPSPASNVSSPDSSASSAPNAFSPLAYPSPASYPTPSSTTGSGVGYSPSDRPAPVDPTSPLEILDCGFCSETVPCLCRDSAPHNPPQMTQNPGTSNLASFELSVNGSKSRKPPDIGEARKQSILDDLPPYQAAVPLPRRGGGVARPSIFPITKIDGQTPATAGSSILCTGDPSNCQACADDPFGKAFCTALGDAICSNPRCLQCPQRDQSRTSNSTSSSDTPGKGSHPSTVAAPSRISSGETMPTNAAWNQLKAHPNIAFADLRLLADVVARRAHCTGPRISPSPPLESARRITTKLGVAEFPRSTTSTPQPAFAKLEIPIPLPAFSLSHVDNVLFSSSGDSSSNPEPPGTLDQPAVSIHCGRQGLREVEAEGVREALAILDSDPGG